VQDQLTFQPSEAFKQGQDYTVTVRAGVQGSAGRTLKQDVQWQFRVTAPLILYAGPVDNIVQNLFVIDPSQLDSPRQLTNAAKGVVGYDIASDGSGVVYSEVQDDGSTKLKLLDTSTGQSRIVYDCPDATCTAPAWRPDGGAVAFERVELNLGTGIGPGVTRVWVLDVATGNASPLFKDNQQLGYSPHWSPDGTKLAVFNLNAGGIVIHDFTNQTDQTIPTVQGEVGDFSPDGKWISFPKVVDLGGNNFVTHLVLVDISGGQYVQHDLVPDNDQANDVESAWMPDSKHLVVARRPQSTDVTSMAGTQLYNVEIDSGKATPIVVDPAYSNSSITLSPSGDTILFQRFPFDKPGARTELWTYNMTTQALTKIVENANFGHWLP
jgi:Tol biopolymer transport system component